MGFDLYGVKPELVGEKPEINWDLAHSNEKTQYHKAFEKFEDDNPGYYFRNNVWYWRALWAYICDEIAPNILTEDDKRQGSYNDSHTINAIKAIYIADKIDERDKSGELDIFEHRYIKSQELLPNQKCEICNGSGRRDGYGSECNACTNGMREHWGKSYPFDATNVREFAKFARASGGFEIS